MFLYSTFGESLLKEGPRFCGADGRGRGQLSIRNWTRSRPVQQLSAPASPCSAVQHLHPALRRSLLPHQFYLSTRGFLFLAKQNRAAATTALDVMINNNEKVFDARSTIPKAIFSIWEKQIFNEEQKSFEAAIYLPKHSKIQKSPL